MKLLPGPVPIKHTEIRIDLVIHVQNSYRFLHIGKACMHQVNAQLRMADQHFLLSGAGISAMSLFLE